MALTCAGGAACTLGCACAESENTHARAKASVKIKGSLKYGTYNYPRELYVKYYIMVKADRGASFKI